MKICVKFKDRLLGNMFRKNVEDMCFPNCNSVHTFFMLKPLDIFMTDRNCKVLYVFKNVLPYRVILPKKNAFYTFEAEVNKYDYKVNEKIPLEK